MSASDRLREANETKSKANLEAGEAFMKANATKPGIVELPGGIQYEVLTDGSGPKPGPTSQVTCHYHGTLIDGTVFDSSLKRGPATFPLNGVIKGWTQALQLMSVGSKWRLFLPPAMAYGDRQVSAAIGPNSTLIFEVELLGIK
jgi:FKBP-type peptidyl-prolyl cis-trans isomerase FklB